MQRTVRCRTRPKADRSSLLYLTEPVQNMAASRCCARAALRLQLHNTRLYTNDADGNRLRILTVMRFEGSGRAQATTATVHATVIAAAAMHYRLSPADQVFDSGPS